MNSNFRPSGLKVRGSRESDEGYLRLPEIVRCAIIRIIRIIQSLILKLALFSYEVNLWGLALLTPVNMT